MHIVQKPSRVEVSNRTCEFHKRHPGKQFPGCTCSSSIRHIEKDYSEMTKEEMEWHVAALRGEKPDGTSLY